MAEFVPEPVVHALTDTGSCMEWSPCGQYLAIGLTNGDVAFAKRENMVASVEVLEAHKNGVECLRWYFETDEQGRCILATGGQNGIVKLWSVESSRLVASDVEIKCKSSWVSSIEWLPGEILAVAAGKSVSLWYHATGELKDEFTSFNATVNYLHYSSSLKSLIASTYGAVHVLNLTSSSWSLEEKGSMLNVTSAPLDEPDCTVIVAAMQDAIIMVWKVKTSQDGSHQLLQKLKLGGYAGKVSKVILDTRTRWIASTGAPGVVVWDMGPRGQCLLEDGDLAEKICVGPKAMSSDVCYSPKSTKLVAGFKDGHVLVRL